MIDTGYVVFKIKVDHKKVAEEWEDVITRPFDSKIMEDNEKLILQSLMCSEYIYVPEQQLSRFIKFGEIIK